MGTLADAGMTKGADIESGWLGNCGMGFWGQNSIRAQALFQPLVEEGLLPERVPMFNVENVCAMTSTAFMGAWKDVLAGTHELSFCIGIEELFSPDAPERRGRGVGGDLTAGLKLIALIAYRDAVYYLSMIRSFGDRKTQALFEDELVRAFDGFADRAKRKLVAIHVAARLDDLRVPPANRLEKLRGDLDGFHSIRINDQWRVIFRWANGDAHGVRIVDYH